MPRVPSYNIEKYSYTHLTEKGHEKFGSWIRQEDWRVVLEATTTQDAVEQLHGLFLVGLRESYEVKSRKKKTSEPVWMTEWLRNDIQIRRRIFKTDQKWTDRWRRVKRQTATAVKKRKKNTTSLF